MLATPDSAEFKIAAAIAEEFVKAPLEYVAPSEEDGTDSYCEVAGLTIYEDRNDPIITHTLTGREVLPERFRLVIDAAHTYPATYWEPECSDEVRIGKADNLISAVRVVAHALLDQSLNDAHEEQAALLSRPEEELV